MNDEPWGGNALCLCDVANATPQKPPSPGRCWEHPQPQKSPFALELNNPCPSKPIQIKKATGDPADLGREAAPVLEGFVMTSCRVLCPGQLCLRLGPNWGFYGAEKGSFCSLLPSKAGLVLAVLEIAASFLSALVLMTNMSLIILSLLLLPSCFTLQQSAFAFGGQESAAFPF